jgi:purine-binding chemotaxis protein CheW
VENTVSIDSTRYLTLTLGEALFAITIHSVREILDYTDITRIPQSSECMKGVVNVRGTAVPVIDLGLKCALQPVVRTPNTRIVIVELLREGRIVMAGLLCDSVREVLEIDPARVAPPPVSGGDLLRGIAGVGEHFVLMLDVDKLFTGEEMLAAQDDAGEGNEGKEVTAQDGADQPHAA